MLVASGFGTRLTELREEAGLSQYALAKKSGVTAQAISKLEQGERDPSWSTVIKLARALGVGIEKFDVKDEPDEPPAPKKKPKR